MNCEVIVVGAGVGGLTAAALLAARGLSVCVIERQSHVGGCVADFEHLGYYFEPTFGLYSGWGDGGTWEQVFSELPLPAPVVTQLSPNYVVHLPDGRDIGVSASDSFEAEIAAAFPECADAALGFLRAISTPTTASDVAQLLSGTSQYFHWFIDAQLQIFAQRTSSQCSLPQAAAALKIARGQLWSIDGGAQSLADRLAESLKRSGGALRLNSPVLRLAYGTGGTPIGVDLLNGERITATRAIVSNLTVWDTYGKLIGPSRTPKQIGIELKKIPSWGAYLMFLGTDEPAIESIPCSRTVLVCDFDSDEYDPERQQLMLNLAPRSKTRAPGGKRALSAIAFTQPEDWFAFHEDHTWHEEKDQALLKAWWERLHQALPQLGDAIEVIETFTPQTAYDSIRRRLGMMGTPHETGKLGAALSPFPNVFLVGDTVSAGFGLEGVARSALKVVNGIAPV